MPFPLLMRTSKMFLLQFLFCQGLLYPFPSRITYGKVGLTCRVEDVWTSLMAFKHICLLLRHRKFLRWQTNFLTIFNWRKYLALAHGQYSFRNAQQKTTWFSISLQKTLKGWNVLFLVGAYLEQRSPMSQNKEKPL